MHNTLNVDQQKPIVELVDIRKTYIMGHGPSGGGLFGRRRNAVDK